MNKSKCVLLYGTPCEFLNGLIKVKQIDYSGAGDNLSKVESVTEDRAFLHYLAAKNLEAKKEYKAALWNAKKAKVLGFLDIDTYLNQLEDLVRRNKE